MQKTAEGQLSPEVVLAEMTRNGVTHVVWLPDSETNFLYQLMQAEPSLRLVTVSREGLAFPITPLGQDQHAAEPRRARRRSGDGRPRGLCPGARPGPAR